MDFVQNRKSKVASVNMRWPIRFEDSMATPVWLCNSHAKNTLRMSGDHHLLWKENAKEENMSERSVAMSWNTKRKRRAATARLRERKRPSCPRLQVNTAANRPLHWAIPPLLVLQWLLSLNRRLHRAIQPPQWLFQATMRAVFILRARTKEMAWKGQTTRMYLTDLEKAQDILITGSLGFRYRIERC